MADFLLELGLEEVPARMLARGQAELGERVRALLGRERLLLPAVTVETYSTPRRLAVLVRGMETQQPDTEEQLTGPAWAVAFKNGTPTAAAEAFARKAGVPVDELTPLTTPKGEYASAVAKRPGRTASALLAELLPAEIGALSWAKSMQWRRAGGAASAGEASKPERFVRPVKWLVALLDEAVVPLVFAGVRADQLSYGHRVLHGPAPVRIGSPASYRESLRDAGVMAEVEERRHTIRKALDRVTRTAPGARWREDEKLVDTVTHLTEWPSVLLGSFDASFLSLPEEVLVTVMRDHQKYFAVEDSNGKLLPHFLTVLNTQTNERGEATIRHGNERVLRARFSDARFFWEFDGRTPLMDRVDLLERVAFQKDLGSYAAKTARSRHIAGELGALAASRGVAVDEAALAQAVDLAKADLTTELVKEFTELQGIIGGVYARAQGLPEPVASAIYWQYRPASIADGIPPTAEGQLLGLADRIGTLVDLFAIGLQPSGSKDPYALRRAGNAVLKILGAGVLPLRLSELLAAAGAQDSSAAAFLRERLDFYLREALGVDPGVAEAVLAAGADDVRDAQARALAVGAVRGEADFRAIAAAWKRTKNILRQAEEKSFALAGEVDPALLREPSERNLWMAMKALVPAVEAFRAARNYAGALEAIATLRPHVDRFFNEVMVLVDDPAPRGNRLALLQEIVHELGRIADFSALTAVAQDAPA